MRALVTGASSGLGLALAGQLATRGAAVISVDRSDPAPGPVSGHFACDLSDRRAVDALLSDLAATGPFALAVLNAGVSATGRFEEIPIDAYQRLVAVNLEAPILIANALVAAGAVQRLVFVSSLSVFTGYAGASVYAATKEGLAAYAASLRKGLRQRGITVTLACPGPLRTAHAARHAPAGSDEGRRMDPDVAAAAILDAAFAGRALVIPGAANKAFAIAGRLLPGFVTRRMRSVVFDRLDGPVW